jgi:hypothetical protein
VDPGPGAPPGGASGLDEPARRGLRRYFRRAAVTIVVGIVVLVATGIVARIGDDRADRLQRDGIEIQGVSFAATAGSWVHFDYLFRGVQRHGAVRATRPYSAGDFVVVLVDPDDSSRVTLLGERNEAPSTSWRLIELGIIGGAIVLLGVCSIGRGLRQRRFLSQHPWEDRPIRVVVLSKWKRPSYQIAVGPKRWQPLDVSTTTPWRRAWSGMRSASLVEVATVGGKYVLVRVPGSESVLSLEAKGDLYVDEPAPISTPMEGWARAAAQLRTGRQLILLLDLVFAAHALIAGPTWLGLVLLGTAVGYALSVRVLVRRGPDGWYGAPAFAR